MTCKKILIAACLISFELLFGSCTPLDEGTAPAGITAPSSIQLNKDMDSAAYLKGTFARINRDFDRAETELTKAVKKDSKNTDLITSAYILMVINGHFDKAAPIAKAIYKDHKDNMMAAAILIVENAQKGSYADNFQYMDAFSPTYKQLFVPMVKAWHESAVDEKEKALKTLETASASDKNGKAPPLKSLYALHHGMIAERAGKDVEAKKDYAKIMESDPDDIRSRTFQIMGYSFQRTGDAKNLEKLKGLYKKQETLSGILGKETFYPPLNKNPIPSEKEGLAEVFFNIGASIPENERESSLVFYRLALYLNPDLNVAKLTLAGALENQTLLDEADKLYADIPPEEENLYVAANLKRIAIAEQHERPDTAIRILDDLYTRYQASFFLITRADFKRSKEDWLGALGDYDALIKGGESSSKLFYMKGMCLERLNRIPESIAALQEARRLAPDNPYILNYLGYVGLEHDINIKESFGYVEKAAELIPNNGEIMDSLGFGYLKLKQNKKALEAMKKAVELEPSSAVIQEHLGDVHMAMKRPKDAAYQYEKALTLITDRTKEKEDYRRISEKLERLK